MEGMSFVFHSISTMVVVLAGLEDGLRIVVTVGSISDVGLLVTM